MECNYAPLGFKVKLYQYMAMVRVAIPNIPDACGAKDAPQASGGAVYCCGLCRLDELHKSFCKFSQTCT